MLQNTKIVRGKHMTVPGVAIFYGKNVTFVKSSSWTALETLCRPSFEELALGRNGLEKGRKNVLDISCTLWRWFLKPRDLKKIDHNCEYYRLDSIVSIADNTLHCIRNIFFWHVDRITSYQSSFAVKPQKSQKIFLFQQGSMNSCRLPKLSNKISSCTAVALNVLIRLSHLIQICSNSNVKFSGFESTAGSGADFQIWPNYSTVNCFRCHASSLSPVWSLICLII